MITKKFYFPRVDIDLYMGLKDLYFVNSPIYNKSGLYDIFNEHRLDFKIIDKLNGYISEKPFVMLNNENNFKYAINPLSTEKTNQTIAYIYGYDHNFITTKVLAVNGSLNEDLKYRILIPVFFSSDDLIKLQQFKFESYQALVKGFILFPPEILSKCKPPFTEYYEYDYKSIYDFVLDIYSYKQPKVEK